MDIHRAPIIAIISPSCEHRICHQIPMIVEVVRSDDRVVRSDDRLEKQVNGVC